MRNAAGDNVVGGKVVTVSKAAEEAAYEALPKPLREFLRYAPQNYDSTAVLRDAQGAMARGMALRDIVSIYWSRFAPDILERDGDKAPYRSKLPC